MLDGMIESTIQVHDTDYVTHHAEQNFYLLQCYFANIGKQELRVYKDKASGCHIGAGLQIMNF